MSADDGNDGSGKVSVDTDAMREVAGNIRAMVELLQKSRNDLANTEVFAGGLPHGWSVNDQIEQVVSQLSGGDGGKDFLGNVIDKLNTAADDLDKRAAAHEQTERENGENSSKMADGLGDSAGEGVANAVGQAAATTNESRSREASLMGGEPSPAVEPATPSPGAIPAGAGTITPDTSGGLVGRTTVRT